MKALPTVLTTPAVPVPSGTQTVDAGLVCACSNLAWLRVCDWILALDLVDSGF
jgi:hypothetical protein